MGAFSMERIDVKKRISNAIEDGKRTIILCAPGGYGKSYIAKEYCNDSFLQDRAFINARDDIRKQLNYVYENQFREESTQNHMQDGAFAGLIFSQLDEFCGDNDTWVVVFDDVALNRDEFRTFVKEFKYVPQRGKTAKGIVIITTQKCWGYRSNGNVEVIDVPEVNEDIAKSFLRESIQGITEIDISKIIRATGRIALPLSIAGASIVKKARLKRLRVTEAVEEFCNEVTSSDAALPDGIDYDKNLYNAILVTVNNILKNEVDPESVYDFLMCSAITAPTQFERQDEYSKELGIANWENAHAAIAGWYLFESDDSFTMHPTTQDVLLHIDKKRNGEEYYKRLCRAANAFTSLSYSDKKRKDGCIIINVNNGSNKYSTEIETAKRIQNLILAAVNEAKTSASYICLCEHLYNLSYGIAFYYYTHTNNYKDREQYYKNAYDAVVKLLDKDPDNLLLKYKKAAQLKYWGVALRALDRNDEAKRCLDEAIIIYDDADKNTDEKWWHELGSEAYYNRGLIQSDKGYTDEVLKDYIASYDIAAEFELREKKAVAQRCIGIYHRDTGNYPEAINWFNKSIKNGDEENAARCLACLGLLFVMRGDWSESIKKSQEAVAKYETANVRTSYNPLLHIEICYRKQGKEELSKEYLLKASRLLFGDSVDSIANQIESILDGNTRNITLNGKDYRRDGIACMLLCVRCIEHIITFSNSAKENINIQKLLDMAFAVRDESFRKLRDKLLLLNNEEMTAEEIFKKVKGYTEIIIYNKLTCATLMLACSEYYNKCDEPIKAFVFAVAAFHLSDSYNYAYGKDASISLIRGFCEPYNLLPIVKYDKQNKVFPASDSLKESGEELSLNYSNKEQNTNRGYINLESNNKDDITLQKHEQNNNVFIHHESTGDNNFFFTGNGINKCLFFHAMNSSLYKNAVCAFDINGENLSKALGPNETRRYKGSICLMKAVWSNHPELGLSPDYDHLMKLEFDRGFHPKYRDHTTHMFKVFLLGIYLYEKHEKIREAINSIGLDSDSFLRVWIMTALSHDVGYLVENNRTTFEMYQRLNLALSQPLTTLFPEDFGLGTERGILEQYSILTQRIERMNPIKNALKRFDGTGKTVRLTVHSDNPIMTYFEKTAQIAEPINTTDQSRSYFDHGIVSAGLILFLQETLCDYYERFPIDELHIHQKERLIKMINSAEDYKRYTEQAAYAVALHNIKKDWSGNRMTDMAIEGVTLGDFQIPLKDEPVAYLLRLCDEIQCWDRQYYTIFPEGKEPLDGSEMSFMIENECLKIHISDPKTRDDIILALNGILEPCVLDILPFVEPVAHAN